jgi:hypothetical protein
MYFLKRFFDFYIQSSLHVGVAVVSLVLITVYSNNLSISSVYPTCVFFGTVLGYNFLKYYEVFKRGLYPSTKHLAVLVVSSAVLIGFIYHFCLLKKVFQVPMIASGLVVLVYPLLRNYGWLKMFLVSFVVTIVTVYIPYRTEKLLLFDYDINILQRFLIIVSLLIPFEILDSKTDHQSMNTLPQLFGITSTKLFGMVLTILFIVLELFKVKSSIAVLPIGLLILMFIYFTSLERNKYYTSFWVESVPILWLLLLFL